MSAKDIRNLYEYHFAINRRIWDESVMTLTDAQFKQKNTYSVGGIRNQVVHLLNIDERWFRGLRGEEVPGFLNPVHWPDRAKIRAKWDEVEVIMREYLAGLTDEMLSQRLDADTDLTIWQVLVHVANHATDHRAQLLAMLHEVGAPTFAQDYVIWLFQNNKKAR